ncbi:hypothetical protein ACJX0J_017167, partial [Zea mays]
CDPAQQSKRRVSNETETVKYVGVLKEAHYEFFKDLEFNKLEVQQEQIVVEETKLNFYICIRDEHNFMLCFLPSCLHFELHTNLGWLELDANCSSLESSEDSSEDEEEQIS